MMNYPRSSYSSSSSSLDSEVGYKEETHYDKRCKYEWHHKTIRGMDVFIFIRVCKCDKYDDMSYLRDLKMNSKEFDGKDVHYHRSCKWERIKRRQQGEKIYVLSANCDSTICFPPNYERHSTCTMNITCPLCVMGPKDLASVNDEKSTFCLTCPCDNVACKTEPTYRRVTDMNTPQGNVSSSSDEDQANPGVNLATPTGKTEQHGNKHCRYKRVLGVINGQNVYIHIRVCQCDSSYNDRKYLLNDTLSLDQMDGKEIHFYPGCKWTRRKENGYQGTASASASYVLHAYCNGCITPQSNHSVRAMNFV